MSSLNIPLGAQSGRPKALRRLPQLLTILLGCVLLWGLCRLWITRDTTSAFHASNPAITLHLSLSASSTQQLQNAIGSHQLLPDSPWTIDDALIWAKRELSIHMNEAGEVQGVSFDAVLDEQRRQSFESFGWNVHEIKGKTLISRGESPSEPRFRLMFASLWPLFDGYIVDWQQNQRFSAQISKEGVRFVGAGQRVEQQKSVVLSENSSVFAWMHQSPSDEPLHLPLFFSPLLSDSSLAELSQMLSARLEQIVLGEDDGGMFFHLIFTEHGVDLQEAAEIAKNLLSQHNLSTTALTIDSETTVSEIRSSTQNIVVDVQDEASTTLLTAQDETGNIMRIAHSDESLVLSNRETPLTLEPYLHESACLSSAHSSVLTAQLLESDVLAQAFGSPNQRLPFLLSISHEIAISNRSTALCW